MTRMTNEGRYVAQHIEAYYAERYSQSIFIAGRLKILHQAWWYLHIKSSHSPQSACHIIKCYDKSSLIGDIHYQQLIAKEMNKWR